MALRDLIATQGEAGAARVLKGWRVSDPELSSRISAAIDAAVADEREACARIADEHADRAWNGGEFEVCQMVARAIRKRSDKQS